jgi:hypothetical protein
MKNADYRCDILNYSKRNVAMHLAEAPFTYIFKYYFNNGTVKTYQRGFKPHLDGGNIAPLIAIDDIRKQLDS